MKIKLRQPIEHVSINQKFGANYVNFYQKLGMLGHNGIDYKAFDGCNIYASHSGIVDFAGQDGDGGVCVIIIDVINHYKTIYYHLQKVLVNKGEYVYAGDKIALSDNTGSMTTGSHLHFGLKFLDESNQDTLNYNNGFKGAVNPEEYIYYTFDGQEISPKDYDKSRCYHRYYRGRPKGGLQNEVKILAILALKRIKPTAEKINALVYGGWDLPTVQNEAMFEIWSQLKKDEYQRGFKPFQNNDSI